VKRIVTTSKKDLQQKTGLNTNDILILLSNVSKLFFPMFSTPKTLSEMLQDPFFTQKLSLGCPIIDSLFHGGLPRRGIIEVWTLFILWKNTNNISL
jgi:hypothetical protein